MVRFRDDSLVHLMMSLDQPLPRFEKFAAKSQRFWHIPSRKVLLDLILVSCVLGFLILFPHIWSNSVFPLHVFLISRHALVGF